MIGEAGTPPTRHRNRAEFQLPVLVAAARGNAKSGHPEGKIDLVANPAKRVAHPEQGALDRRGDVRATPFSIVPGLATLDPADLERPTPSAALNG